MSRPSDERYNPEPYVAIWRELNRYSGRDASERAVSMREGRNRGYAAEIRHAIRNADLFYQSYYDADELIDPVLLYYGAVWLASAIIYVEGRDEQITFWRKRPAHGVKPRFSANSLLDAEIEFFERGTVQSLCRVLAGDFIQNQRIRVLDLLRCLPDLRPQLEERGHDILPVRVYTPDPPLREQYVNRGLQRVQYVGGTGFTRIAVAPAFVERGANVQSFDHSGIIYWTWRGAGDDDINTLTMLCDDGRFFESRLPQGYFIPEPAVHLILLHALSEFARYRPEVWIQMADNHDDDYALIRAYVEIAERRLPNLTLNELSRRTYIIRR